MQVHNAWKSAQIPEKQVTPTEKRTKLVTQTVSENIDVQTSHSDSVQHTSQIQTTSDINTTRPEEEVELEPKSNYSESLINQLRQMHLKQPVRIDGQVHYKSSEELERLWEASWHLTVKMEDNITKRYIQELLDTALIFYFSKIHHNSEHLPIGRSGRLRSRELEDQSNSVSWTQFLCSNVCITKQ
jgi:hypothetical protein